MEEQNKYDLFDRYLRGELEERELDDFLEKLKSDEELKEEFEQYRYLVDGIREHQKQELKGFMVKNARTRFIGNPWSLTFTYASAAILIGFGILYIVLENTVKQDSLVDKHPTEVPEPLENADDDKTHTDPVTEHAEMTDPGQPAEVPEKGEQALKKIPEVPTPEVEADMEISKEIQYPELGDMHRLAGSSQDDNLPVKADARIMDTLITLSIHFEMQDRQLNDTSESPEGGKSIPILSEKILVQFWESPINYKGYRFDGRKLVLFGLDTFSLVELKYRVIDHALKAYDIYLVYGNLYVKLKDDNRYNAYIRETNSSIINELK